MVIQSLHGSYQNPILPLNIHTDKTPSVEIQISKSKSSSPTYLPAAYSSTSTPYTTRNQFNSKILFNMISKCRSHCNHPGPPPPKQESVDHRTGQNRIHIATVHLPCEGIMLVIFITRSLVMVCVLTIHDVRGWPFRGMK